MHLKPDSITEWRINQVALAEARTFANAFATMIKESWDYRSKAATLKMMTHGLPDHHDPAPTDTLNVTVSAHITADLLGAIKRVAEVENRPSISSTIGILIRDGLKGRAAKAPATVAA